MTWLVVTDRPLRSALTSTETRDDRRRGAMIRASWAIGRARSRSGPHGSDAGSTPAAEASAGRARGAPRLFGDVVGLHGRSMGRRKGARDMGPPRWASPLGAGRVSSSNSGGPPRRGRFCHVEFCGRVFTRPGFSVLALYHPRWSLLNLRVAPLGELPARVCIGYQCQMSDVQSLAPPPPARRVDIFAFSELLNACDDFLSGLEDDHKSALSAGLMEQFVLHSDLQWTTNGSNAG
jgi:hypothetical protein